jgi:hypothetical protein
VKSSIAPLTCQFILEDHAVWHSYHHLAAIRRAFEVAEKAALSVVGVSDDFVKGPA